jgi:drug/metabolite transporter (DMT)-like permease
MIYTLSPLVLLCILALIGERFTHRKLMRVGLGLAGVYLLIGPGSNVSGIGVLLAMMAVFAVPLQLTLMQLYLRDYDWRAVTFYLSLVMFAVIGGWWLIQGAEWQDPGPKGWILLVTLAVVTTYLSRLAQTSAVARLGAGQVGLLAPLETLLTVTWSVLFLADRFSPLQALGGGLILLSALLASQRLLRVRWGKPITSNQ